MTTAAWNYRQHLGSRACLVVSILDNQGLSPAVTVLLDPKLTQSG